MNTNLKDLLSESDLEKLNCIFSTWKNIGSPDSLSLKGQYFEADGHEIYCCGYIKLNFDFGVGAVDGGLQLFVQHYIDCGQNMSPIGPIIKTYPKGYFWPNWNSKKEEIDYIQLENMKGIA